MKTETLHPVTDYIQALFDSLGISEGFEPLQYFDTEKRKIGVRPQHETRW